MPFSQWKKVEIYHHFRHYMSADVNMLLEEIERVFFTPGSTECKMLAEEHMGKGYDIEAFFKTLAKLICDVHDIPDWRKQETPHVFRSTSSEPNFAFRCNVTAFSWTHSGDSYQFRQRANIIDRYGYSVVWWLCKNTNSDESPNYDIDSRSLQADTFAALDSLHQRLLRLEGGWT